MMNNETKRAEMFISSYNLGRETICELSIDKHRSAMSSICLSI
jgi:hypothetical protein